MRALLIAGAVALISGILLRGMSEVAPPRDPETWMRDPRGTEIAWQRAAVADARRIPQRDFVLGHLHWQRADQASAMLAEPQPPVAAFARPIVEVEAAWRSWTAAAEAERRWRRQQGRSSVDWLPALRNAERAWNRLQELRTAEEEARQRQEQSPPPPPDPGAGTEGDEPGDETSVAATDRALTVEELRGLRDRLREQQEAKRTERLAQRATTPGGDW